MRIVDLSMTVEECDSAPFAKDEYYFKLRPIVTWEDKGFVSNLVEMTVHAGTHIDSPHHFFRHMPGVEQIPLDAMIGEAIVMDLTFKGTANARIVPEDLERAGYRYAAGIEGTDRVTCGSDAVRAVATSHPTRARLGSPCTWGTSRWPRTSTGWPGGGAARRSRPWTANG